jgi:hypothetical protein
MSQFYQGVVAGSLPPAVPTSFVTDSGTAIPVANILNVLTDQTSSNFDKGMTDTGSGNTVTTFLTNRATGSLTTADATKTTILTFPMSATPGTFYVYGNIVAFNSSVPSSGAFSFSGGYRTDGASATELGTEFHDTFQDAALVTADIFLDVSGNNILVQVQGVVALSINWNCLLEFRQVN